MSKENFDKKLIKLLESNPDFVDEAGELLRANVRERAWKLDLDIWRDMCRDSVLNWYVKPQKTAEAEEHFIAINDVEKQKKLLVDLLDKNQLYVHLCQIEDETFKVSEADYGE